MAALVQAYPQQSSTITMLQTRPSSASGILQSPQPSSHHQYATNQSQMNRNSFHGGLNNGMGGATSYRGNTIAPYAFTSTPGLAVQGQQTKPHLRTDQRTSSAPIIPTFEGGNMSSRSRYPAPASISTTSSSSSSDLSALSQKSGTRDDSTIFSTNKMGGNARPHSTIFTSSTSTLAPPQTFSAAPAKSSPDRYRRPNNRRAESSPTVQQVSPPASVVGSTMPNVMEFYGTSAAVNATTGSLKGFSVQMPPARESSNGSKSVVSADDMQINTLASNEQAKRYRRRSIHTIEPSQYTYEAGSLVTPGLQNQGSRQLSSANGRIDQQQQQHPLRSSPIIPRPGTSHGRNDSSESVSSVRSSRPGSVSKFFLAPISRLFISSGLIANFFYLSPITAHNCR